MELERISGNYKYYISLFNNVPDAVLIMDGYSIIDCNYASLKMFGYTSKEEIMGLQPYQLSPEKQPDGKFSFVKDKKMVDDTIEKGSNMFEWVHRRKDGTYFDAEVILVHISEESKKIIGVTIRDITKRKEDQRLLKKALTKLSESKKKFKKLFNNANDVIFLSELGDGFMPLKIIDVNDYACEKLGYTKEEILSIVPKDMLNKNNYKTIEKMAKELLEKGDSTIDITYTSKDGTTNFFEVKSHVFILNDKKVVISIWRDITDRNKREKELQLQKSYFQQLFLNSPEAIAILDNKDRIIDINHRFNNLFQYSINEIRGAFINDIIIPKTHKEEASKLSNKVMTGGVVRAESVRKNKQGELINVDILGYPIIHEGNQIGIYSIYRDITEDKRKEKEMENLAIRDKLTGLYNRSFFLDKLNIEINKAEKIRQSLAIMSVDVDRFKSINDNLGHVSGDRVLRIIANRIKRCIDKKNIIARVGGDEFFILLLNIEDSHEIVRKARQIMNRFEKPIYISQFKFYMTISIGIAFYPINGDSYEALIKNANVAMHRAKEYSGNRYEFYTSNLHEKLKEEFIIVNGLRKAQERGEFSIYYQPIVDLQANTIVGAEALIRWHHPQHGNISPSRFIPIAESRGFIGKIGKWVLKNACIQNKRWQEAGFPHIFIAVNISVKQLEQDDFIHTVKEILKETKLDPKYLELEITESISLENVKDRLFVLRTLEALGIKLSIDDFGTGFSSLSQLKKLCVSKLKIDRSFIKDINIDPNNTAIVSTIIAIAKKLNLNVVAEGVETKDQLDFLNIEKCNMVQGYIYSPPVPSKLFEKLIDKNLVEIDNKDDI